MSKIRRMAPVSAVWWKFLWNTPVSEPWIRLPQKSNQLLQKSTDPPLNKFHKNSSETFRMKKALGDTQILPGGRSNAQPKNFAPPQTPFPGAQDRQI